MNMENGGGPVTGVAGPRAKCDQVIFEALAKATEIIVGSRGGGNNQGLSPPSISSRFNLTLPENATLRNILQRWKRALHLPIRLDVYYEHDGNRRELLERWCLGYVVGDGFWRDQHNAALLKNTTDPIVQLRHICKKIVIWLRTLYCFARLLPCAAFLNAKLQTHSWNGATDNDYNAAQPLGFALYAVSEDTDDIFQLKQQGFLHHAQPASPVTTPYGELSWQVLYAPRDNVHKLLPQPSSTSEGTILHSTNNRTSQAIPIANATRETSQRADHFDSRSNGGLPQTAPAHINRYLMKERQTTTDTETSTDNTFSASPIQRNTYNPNFFMARERLTVTEDARKPQAPLLKPGAMLQRRHTSIGKELDSDQQPARVLSGLSLALMNSDNAENRIDLTTHNMPDENNDAAAEKRRAALHQMPPHLHQPAPRATSNDYGYAYNNHIPRTLFTETPDNAALGITVPRESSPSPLLGTTPPLGVLYGAVDHGVTTPPPSSNITMASLIPPRNSLASVTPPFAARPAGFVQDQNCVLPPPAVTTTGMQPVLARQENDTTDMAPLTSLDMLHDSPFHISMQQHYGGSMLSSLSGGGVFGSEAASLFYNSVDMRKSVSFEGSTWGDDDDCEEMPFAVDNNLPAPDHSLQVLASSAAVTSFAQKCSIHQRLELFDRPTEGFVPQGHDEDVDQLADQLADFRSFGASLRLSKMGGSGSEVEGSTTAPISLRI